MKYLGGCLNKVLGTLLHGDTTQEGHHLAGLAGRRLQVKQFFIKGLNSVVYSRHLVGADAIFLDDSAPCEVAHGDDVVGVVHTVLLDAEHRWIDVAAAAVKVGRVDVDHKWLAGHLLGVDASGVGEPVMGVDDVAIDGSCDHARHNTVIVNLLEQVLRIASRELDAPKVVGAHVVEITIDVVTQVEVQLRIHHLADAALHIIPFHIAPGHRCAVSSDDVGKILRFVSPGLWDDKCDVHVSIFPHALSEAVTCGSQSS